ncbi:hypothetical protein, partial [Phascolarctobacterium faecium]|uniref:hypothetical protein n=1 Tax=Phascolarctobacterium faecium TaxID=33025 RepID=UPI003AB0E731
MIPIDIFLPPCKKSHHYNISFATMQIVVKVNKKAAELSSAAKYFMERETRFELATRGLGSRCSTTELH